MNWWSLAGLEKWRQSASALMGACLPARDEGTLRLCLDKVWIADAGARLVSEQTGSKSVGSRTLEILMREGP
jgi:hypothetical protein